MSLIIPPTVGRKVYFYVNAAQRQPFDATIIRVALPPEEVQPETLCNLNYVDPDTGATTFVRDVQASEDPVDVPHFRWMPTQVGQATYNARQDIDTLAGRIEQLAQASDDMDKRITGLESAVVPPPASTPAPEPKQEVDPGAAPAPAPAADTPA